MEGFDEERWAEKKRLWELVKVRSNGLCECCGMEIPDAKFKYLDEEGNRKIEYRQNGSVHHRHMKQFGGEDRISNLVHLWHPHHKRIHKSTETERVYSFQGLIAWGSSTDTPFFLHGERWVLLDDAGNYTDIDERKARALISAFAELEPNRGDLEMEMEEFDAQTEHVDLGRGIKVDHEVPIVIMSTLTPPSRLDRPAELD